MNVTLTNFSCTNASLVAFGVGEMNFFSFKSTSLSGALLIS